jgi:hypothetical protein
MNQLSQTLPALRTGDTVKIVLQSGSLTGRIEEYRQNVHALDLSEVCFSGMELPFIFTISTYLILELSKL